LRTNTPVVKQLLVAVLCLTTILAGAPVSAQDADPIADLLGRQGEEMSEEEAEGLPPGPQPYVSPPSSPPAYARPYEPPPRRPTLTEPVFVDQLGRTPEAPLSGVELSYEQRLRASFAAAQGLQGGLDGAWTLRSPTGAPIYALQIVDQGRGDLGGSWRDLSRQGALDASGFLDDVRQSGGQLVLRFSPRAGVRVHAALNAAGAGWSGELEQNGDRIPVTLVRN
jgi:hypothetical protein